MGLFLARLIVAAVLIPAAIALVFIHSPGWLLVLIIVGIIGYAYLQDY